MLYKKRTYDRIAYTVFLLNAIMTYSNVHYGKGLDVSISFFICLGVIGVLSCIYEVAYETLTGEPMNILVTFLDLLSQKRKKRLAKVSAATAIPVQVLSLPAPDILEVDIQEPVLDGVVIDDTKEGIKEESHAEPEIITEVEAIEVQEEIPDQESDSLSPSVPSSEMTAAPSMETPPVSPVVPEPEKDWEVEEQEKTIEKLYSYSLYYIDRYLNEEEKSNLLYNITEIVTKDKPDFKPLFSGKKSRIHKYDFFHLFHAIGYHTGNDEVTRDTICRMVYKSIPGYFESESQISSIGPNLTRFDSRCFIPVIGYRDPLPDPWIDATSKEAA